MDLTSCPGMAVPLDVMHHVVRVESSYNPYAIGVVGGRLVRQPKSLPEALATVQMLEGKGYNFSLGLAQVNRYNLIKYGLPSYERAFQVCANLQAGSRILAECYNRSGKDWGKSFSCYYSGDFQSGFRHGYVEKIYTSIRRDKAAAERAYGVPAIALVGSPAGATGKEADARVSSPVGNASIAPLQTAATAPVSIAVASPNIASAAASRPYDSADIEARPPPSSPRDIILATRTADAAGGAAGVGVTGVQVDPNAVVRLADLQHSASSGAAEPPGSKQGSAGVVDGAFVF